MATRCPDAIPLFYGQKIPILRTAQGKDNPCANAIIISYARLF
jgi:hypothetical protein